MGVESFYSCLFSCFGSKYWFFSGVEWFGRGYSGVQGCGWEWKKDNHTEDLRLDL